MGKASSAKKVARAARTGGGRTRRGSTSWAWPSLMALVVVLGTAGIVYSRDQRQPDNTRPLPSGAGRTGDHWHAAIGFDICGTLSPPLPQPDVPAGLHTHGDGLIHIEPTDFRSSGKRARLEVLFESVNTTASATQLKLPDQEVRRNGERCEEGPAEVQMKVWDSRDPADTGRLVEGNPSEFRPQDGMLITIAFLPPGADIPRPPSVAQLEEAMAPTDPTASTSSTVPGPAATTTTVADPNAPTSTTPTSTTAASTTSTSRP